MTSDTDYPDMSYKSGWNPYQPFYPKDEFSKKMLSSIITKVSKWLENMNQDTTGQYDELGWNYTPEGGTIIYANESPDRFIQIWWDLQMSLDADGMNEHNAYTIKICGSDKRFEDVANNLEFFTAVEHSIYNELEHLQKDLYDHFSSERFLVPKVETQEETQEEAFERDLHAASSQCGDATCEWRPE